jgi:hypothetical protein
MRRTLSTFRIARSFWVACALISTLGVAAPTASSALGCGQLAQAGRIFNSYNNCATLNGAKPVVVALAKPAQISQIADYHFHNGVAVKPGTIGLEAPNGYIYGPFRAVQQTGTWDWIANANITVPPGSYTVIDSDPATWSQNSFSSGRGFTRVFGAFVASAPPVPAHTPTPATTTTATPTSPALPLCSGTPPSTFLIYPNHAAVGTTISLLLSCQKPVAQAFLGAFAPVKVLIYDEASFHNLKYVSGYLQPISASLPVRAPIAPTYKVAGNEALRVNLPASIRTGVYVVVIEDAKGEVASQNLLNVP